MFRFTTISIILFLTTGINLFTVITAWKRRNTIAGAIFAAGMVGVTVWTLAAALDYAAVEIPLKVLFAKFETIGYSSALALIALFSFFYAGDQDLAKKWWFRALFIIFPLLIILLAWTNELHGWFWSGFSPSPVGNNIVIFHHGPGFPVVSLIGYGMVGVMLVNLWRVTRRGALLSQRQARLLFVAALIPVVSNLVYLVEIPGFAGVDWSSLTFSISGLLFLAALYGTRFLDLIPIARFTVIEQMKDSVLVLDVGGQMIDYNPSAGEIFGIGEQDIGKRFDELLGDWPALKALLGSDSPKTTSIRVPGGDLEITFDAQISTIADGSGQAFGKLIVLRNITEQAILESEFQLQQQELARVEERQRMARDLHDSVNQSIHSMVLFAETLATTYQRGDSERAERIVSRLQESARQSQKEIRLLLYQLQAEDTERLMDLLPDLETRLATVERRAGMKSRFHLVGEIEHCPPEWYENLYWIAIEALNNSLKHAQADEVDVILTCLPDRVELEVADNGIGFVPDELDPGGMGVNNLQARAALLGGAVEIDSAPGNGTRVRFSASR